MVVSALGEIPLEDAPAKQDVRMNMNGNYEYEESRDLRKPIKARRIT